MDDLSKRLVECRLAAQQANAVAIKAAPLIAAVAVLQESVNANKLLCEKVTSLIEGIENERKNRSADPDGQKVPGETQPKSA